LLIKSKIAHQAGYYLLQGRWHAIKQEKPAPKGAPQAAHPEAGGKHSPISLSAEQIDKLKYPTDKAATNKEMAAFNDVHLPKLLAHGENGDATAILGHGYGVNTHGKKQAAVANFLLGKMGSQHQVSAGQKPGEHAAVKASPAGNQKEPPAVTASSNPEALELLDKIKNSASVSAAQMYGQIYLSKFASTADFDAVKQAKAGQLASMPGAEAKPADVAASDSARESKTGGTSVGHMTPQIQAALDEAIEDGDKEAFNYFLNTYAEGTPVHHAALVASKISAANSSGNAGEPPAVTESSAAAGALKMPDFAEGKTTTGVKSHYEKVAQQILDLAHDQDAVSLEDLKADGHKLKGQTWAGKTANSKKLIALHQAAIHQIYAAWGHEDHLPHDPAKVAAMNPAAKHFGDVDPGDAMEAEKDAINHYYAELQTDSIHDIASGKEVDGMTYSPAAQVYAQQALSELDPQKFAPPPALAPSPAPVAKAPEPAPNAVEPEKVTASSGQSPSHVNLDKMPWDGLLLPESNTNAKSHNGKLEKIKALAYAGDVAGLEAMKFGSNTYGKKQAKIAAAAIAALKESPAAAPAAPAATPAPEKPASASPDPAGPLEGEMKQGADGMLVFKDGHWHKVPGVDNPHEAAMYAVAQVPLPHLTDFKKPEVVAGCIHTLLQKVKAEGPAALVGTTKVMKKSGKTIVTLPRPGGGSVKITGFLSMPEGSHVALYHYVEALKAAVGPVPKGKGKAAAPTAPAAPAGDKPPSMDAWSKVGGQLGSNPGGKYVDPDGVAWYCKFPKDEDMAKSEVLAAQLYAAAGVTGQNCKLVTHNGQIGIASKWEEVTKAPPAEMAKADGTSAGFAVDAWLGNWDAVGLEYDNLQLDANGKAVRVDAGGALEYRAMGGKKAFGNQVTEIDTMRDPKINHAASVVFGKLTKADITASVAKVVAVSDDEIYDLVMKHGPGDLAKKAHLVETLIARKENLLEQFPKAVKKAAASKAKPKPDPTKLDVKASDLPQPHDFHNWKGAGNGLSSKPHVNETNLKAEQDLLAFASKGNLIALKDYHFDAVDKETGEAAGSQHIEQHPSQHVKAYWSDLVSTLNYIAHPPERLKAFKSVMAVGLKKVSDAFQSAKYGVTINKVHANSRLAFWIALGHTKPAVALLPAGGSKTLAFQSSPVGTPSLTEAMRSSAKLAYAGLASNRLVKRFINGIQSSGSYNDNFRDGLMVTSDGRDATGMVLDAYSFATEKPEGFEIYKWINFSGDMKQQMLKAQPGTVFQNPGSMCCSYVPNGTSGFGADRIRIRYAKGAKAVDSFGSGSFSSEKEITTLPGQRFVIMSCQKVFDPHKGKERIELDVLMLPPDETYVSELEANKGKHGQS
jgi:hypothetical protein